MAKWVRFYHRWRELIQLCSYLVMLGTICGGIYIICNFISTSNATASAVIELERFRETTIADQAAKNEDIKNIDEKLDHIDVVLGKVFERMNQIADREPRGR